MTIYREYHPAGDLFEVQIFADAMVCVFMNGVMIKSYHSDSARWAQ